MRACLFAALALALAPAAPAADPAGPDELDGTWVEVVPRPSRTEHPGYHPPRDPTTLVVSGTSFVVKAGDRVVRQSLVRRVPGGSPKAADLMTVVGGEFWLTRAAYRVEGDVLTISEAGRDRPRPTALTRGDITELVSLTTYRRQPGGAPPP